MGRKPIPENKKMGKIVTTRVTDEKYQELKHITEYPPHHSMGHLVRCVLDDRQVKIFTSDPLLEPVLEELGMIRQKIRLTGTLINQNTKRFHSEPHPTEKEFYAKQAFMQYAILKPYIARILEILKEMSKRCLYEEL